MREINSTLSVCLLVRSSRAGLERLLDEVDAFADEIIIGVDAASTDATFNIAAQRADVVFRFEHVGPPVRMRLPILDHAHSDWILSLDEDEGLDDAWPSVLPELLAQRRYSHFWFPRKWIVNREPLSYAHAAPWYPDWQLRLFRNDRRRVWHPGIVHSGYRVMGAGCREDRVAILHYEPVTLTAQERASKVQYYDAHGSQGRSDNVYLSAPSSAADARVTSAIARAPGDADRPRTHRVVPGVLAVPPAPQLPPWGMALDVAMGAEATSGAPMLAEVVARNTGVLAWESGGTWPHVNLSSHLLRASGEVVSWDGERFPLPRIVEPGESARFLVTMPAPRDAGAYIIEWDMVSEGECWFAQCGSQVVRSPVRVRN